jgi:hypothetical protein
MPLPHYEDASAGLSARGGTAVKKWIALVSVTAAAAAFVAALAGKDDIRRFWLMHNM